STVRPPYRLSVPTRRSSDLHARMTSRKSGTPRDSSTPKAFGARNDKREDARMVFGKIDHRACRGRHAATLPSDKAGKMPACRVRDRKSTRLNSSHGSNSYAV